MGKSILILDDDVDFNSLLTDIFTQAEYEVFSEQDPKRALEIFQQEAFDLVVTDQKMPNLSGAEFMRKIKSIRSEVPVIMVSGYLDNDTIRDLIKEGVGGVFLKPLNVFSLLKRTSELIEESESEKASHDETQPGLTPQHFEYANSLPFKFRSYPCKSELSADFARKLHSLRNFKTNLLLIGEKGIPFKAICEDLREFSEGVHEKFVYLVNEQLDADRIDPLIRQAAESGVERLTLVMLEAQEFGEDQKNLVVRLSRKEGLYANLAVPVRIIFCLNEDLDVLYERGAIDENLYIIMGTSEARAPALNDCKEDIPILAQQFVVDAISGKNRSNVPRIDKSGRQWLQEQVWKENHQELWEFIANVVGRVDEDLLTGSHFKSILEGEDNSPDKLTHDRFIEKLTRARNEYARAMLILCQGNRAEACKNLKISGDLLSRILAEEL